MKCHFEDCAAVAVLGDSCESHFDITNSHVQYYKFESQPMACFTCHGSAYFPPYEPKIAHCFIHEKDDKQKPIQTLVLTDDVRTSLWHAPRILVLVEFESAGPPSHRVIWFYKKQKVCMHITSPGTDIPLWVIMRLENSFPLNHMRDKVIVEWVNTLFGEIVMRCLAP